MMKPQFYDEQPIVEITLPEHAQEDIRSGNVERALRPDNFPDRVREMATVADYVAKLTFFQRGLLLDALAQSLRESHGARAAFSVQPCGYALEGIGIEIRNDTVTEDEHLQPMKIIFAVSSEYDERH